MVVPSLVDEEEAARIAAELTVKYGADAVDFVCARAERALSVGDDLAYASWQTVLDALHSGLPGDSPAQALAMQFAFTGSGI